MFEYFEDIKVGEPVFVDVGNSLAFCRVSNVVRVMKRFIELEDGTKWDFHGHGYPHDTWSTRRIRRAKEEDYQKIYRQYANAFIRHWKPEDSDDETIIRVYDAMRGIYRKPRKK